MNSLAKFQRRLGWINLPGALLMMLLQRLPAVSVAVATEEMTLAAPVGALLKSAVAVLGALGAVNTMVGATPLVPSSGTASGITVNAGSSVSVFYTVNGTQTPPMSWHVTGNIPPGLNFSGLTSPGSVNVGSLQLSGTPTAGGSYSVTLQTFEFTDTDGIGSPVYSYTITVNGSTNVAPSFTTQPSSQTITAGGSVTFTAAASGTPTPTYQWRKNGNNIGGANSTSFSIGSVSSGDAGDYTVVATNSQGSVTSNTATLTVNAALSAPSFTSQPNSQSVTAGGSVTFTASANGNPTPGYQWRKNGNDIGGANSSSFSIGSVSSGDAGNYTVVASNSQGSATSNAATLTVNAALSAPNFTSQPVSQTVSAGGSVTFTASANGNPAPGYQWRKDGNDIGGANSSSFSIVGVATGDAGSYTVVVSNSQGTATSNMATLTVLAAPSFTLQPTAQIVAAGRPVTFTATATGNPAPSYQWKKGGTNIPGATASSYSIPYVSSDAAAQYTVVASNSQGNVASNSVWLVVTSATHFDFDGDNRSEPVWHNTVTGEVRSWFLAGGSVGYGNEGGGWAVIGSGDFDGDGRSEPLWHNTNTGEVRAWFLAGGSVGYGNEGGGWSVIGSGDFDGDGRSEPVWHNANTGEVRAWFLAGGSVGYGNEGGGWAVIGCGDFDGDGRDEPLWHNTVTGEVRAWFLAGGSVGYGNEGGGWAALGTTADFDGDGRDEPLWHNTTTGEVRAWFLAGGSVGYGNEGGGWTVIDTGDFDGDGRGEPLWHNTVTGEVRAWFLAGGSVGYGSEGSGWLVVAH